MSRLIRASDALPGATIYLAEPGVTELDQLVKRDGDYEDIELDPTLGIRGRLLVGRHPEVEPDWVDALESITTRALPPVTTTLASAALIVRLAGRWFAFAFGQGRHLLRQDALVDDFGLRVAANTVDPGQVRGVDARRFERGVVLTRRQGSRPGRAEGLGLQVDREMLQAIVGRSRRAGEGRVHGRKSLGVARDVDLRDLDRLGAEMLSDYASRDFVDGFPTLERLQAEPKNSALAQRLDADIVNALRDPDSQGAYLAPPAILDWEKVSGFRFSGESSTVRREEASLNDYLLLRPAPTLADLHEDELRVVDRGSMRALDRWPIYRWLVWEMQHGSDAFVLSEGRWYKVNAEYLASIDSAAQRIQRPSLTVPVPTRASMPEAEYNTDLATALGGVLLDKLLAQVGTERGRFELCDVFVPPDKLLHVKRGIGSQELSYLFTQGVTSAEGMRHERKVRERFQDLVHARAPHLGDVIAVDQSQRPEPWRSSMSLSTKLTPASPLGSPSSLAHHCLAPFVISMSLTIATLQSVCRTDRDAACPLQSTFERSLSRRSPRSKPSHVRRRGAACPARGAVNDVGTSLSESRVATRPTLGSRLGPRAAFSFIRDELYAKTGHTLGWRPNRGTPHVPRPTNVSRHQPRRVSVH